MSKKTVKVAKTREPTTIGSIISIVAGGLLFIGVWAFELYAYSSGSDRVSTDFFPYALGGTAISILLIIGGIIGLVTSIKKTKNAKEQKENAEH